MFRTPAGEEVFVIDGHTHYWDASPENQKSVHGQEFIDCFYGYHTSLSPMDQLWPKEQFQKYSPEQMHDDLFVEGPDDLAIAQSTYLKAFYKNGFNTIERNAELARRYPGRFILNGSFDPRDGTAALDYIHYLKEEFGVKGVKLYTAEWNGDSRGWKLTDPAAYTCLELCQSLGITNIHVHKGPTIKPLDMDSFDVHDVDHAATDFQGLNFIIEHCGLPRLDDFCWIATQESNVYGGLAVAMPFILSRPRYFAEVISELLFWVGEDKLLFGSDYAIWRPRWLVERFWSFQLPDDIRAAHRTDLTTKGVRADLTEQAKRKILGLNAARLYDIDIESHKARFAQQPAVASARGRTRYAIAHEEAD